MGVTINNSSGPRIKFADSGNVYNADAGAPTGGPTVQPNATPYSQSQLDLSPVVRVPDTISSGLVQTGAGIADRIDRSLNPAPKTESARTTQEYKLSRDGFAMDEDLSAQYGSYENYLNNIVTDEYKRKATTAPQEVKVDQATLAYSYDPQAYIDAINANNQKIVDANNAKKTLVSESEMRAQAGIAANQTFNTSSPSMLAAASENFRTQQEYRDFLNRQYALSQREKGLEISLAPVNAAQKTLDALKAQNDALYRPNYGAGNIDLSATPRFENGDGTYSTVRSMSFYDDKTGLEILIPTIIKDENGQWYAANDEQAIENYYKTGKYFGAFRTVEDANAYAIKLHNQQEELFDQRAKLSAQIQAQADLGEKLYSDWKNGAYADYLSDRAAFTYEYDYPQYLRDNGATYEEAKSNLDALELEIASLSAGTDLYDSAVRKRDQLRNALMSFATDDEIAEAMKAPGTKKLAGVQADAAMYERLDYDVANGIDPNSDEEYLRLKREAEHMGLGLSRDEELLRDATAEKIRRDTTKMVEGVKGTGAEKLFDILAQYAVTGEMTQEMMNAAAEADPTLKAVLHGDKMVSIAQVRTQLRKQLEKEGKFDEQQIANALEELNRRGNALRNEKQSEKLASIATSGFVPGAAMTVLSFVTNMLSPVGLIESLRGAYTGAQHMNIDPNSDAMLLNNATNAIRGSITQSVDWKVGNTDVFDEVYGIGTSMVDSVLASYVPGGGALLGATAATQTMNDMAREGASFGETMLTAIVAGANEMIWESLSIGNINALKEVDVLNYGDFLKNIAKSFGVNFSEEFNTTLFNTLFDRLKSSSYSDTNLAIADYMQKINPETGRFYTKPEAKAKVYSDQAKQMWHDGFTGALQGGITSVLMQAFGLANMSKARKWARTQQASDTICDITDGNFFAPQSRTFQQAQELLRQFNEVTDKQSFSEFLSRNVDAVVQLRQTMIEEWAQYGPKGITPEMHRVIKERVAAGDSTPIHMESETETKIREAQANAGMTQEEIDATRQLVLDVVNGSDRVSAEAKKVDGELLRSMKFRAVIKAVTGQELLGDSAAKVRKALSDIAEKKRNETIDFTPVANSAETPQTNLVQPEAEPAPEPAQPSDPHLADTVQRTMENAPRSDWYNAPTQEQTAQATEAPAAETPAAETAQPAGASAEKKTLRQRFMDLMTGKSKKAQAAAAATDTGSPITVVNRSEEQTQPAEAQDTNAVPKGARIELDGNWFTEDEFVDVTMRATGESEEAARELFRQLWSGELTRADEAKEDWAKKKDSIILQRVEDNKNRLTSYVTGDQDITERQYNMERALNFLMEGTGVKIKFVPGDVLVGRNGQMDNETGTLYINAWNGQTEADTNTGAGVAWVVGHELFHGAKHGQEVAKGVPPEKDLINKVIGYMSDEGYVDGVMQKLAKSGAITGRYAELALDPEKLQKEIDAIKTQYKTWHLKNGKTQEWVDQYIDDNYIREEIAGDFFGALLGINDIKEAKGYLGSKFKRADLFQILAGVDPSPLRAAEMSLSQKLKLMRESGMRGKDAFDAYDTLQSEMTGLLDDIQTALKTYEPGKVNGVRESISSFALEMGIDVSRNPETHEITYRVNGEKVSEITREHVKDHSGVGVMIRLAEQNGNISAAEANRQYQAMADLMNTIMKTQDPELYWNWAGATIFSAVRSNSDAQYSTTVDFSTVCRKTQDMLTAVSSAMMKRAQQNPEGYGGLTKEEITALQAKVNEAGLPVPCPVCYVFSRWAGAGGILDNINRLQRKFGSMPQEQIIAQREQLEQQMIDRGLAKKNKDGSYTFQREHIDKLVDEKSAAWDRMQNELAGLELLAEKGKATAEQQERITTLREDIGRIKSDLDLLGEWQWVKKVVSDKDYKPVPLEVLYNLDDGETFARDYSVVWGWRTTRGSGAGKAILPYSDMRLGDFFVGAKKGSSADESDSDTDAILLDNRNAFSSAVYGKDELGNKKSKQSQLVRSATKRVRAQNLIGGQRLQSTSDFRYEYALDYLQTFLEMQALGSKAQTYTKVREFVDIICSVGGDCNMSVMPKGKGYENGKLVFSNVTGMDIAAALDANRAFDNAQLILVGINDEHIMLALEDSEETGGIDIGFVIPYHTSGAKIEGFISELVANLGERINIKDYQDYTKVQGDSIIKAKDADGNLVDGRTDAQIALTELRKHLLTGKDGNKNWHMSEQQKQDLWDMIGRGNVDILGRSFEDLREVEKRALAGDPKAIGEYKSWTQANVAKLFERLWTKEGQDYDVRLTSAQAEMIMPYEFWDTRTTRENAYINDFLFRSYCYNLGLRPRFTGWSSDGTRMDHGDFSESKGYWKTLIDRPMYNNDGTYREQQAINISDFNNNMLSKDYAQNYPQSFRSRENDFEKATRVGAEFAEANPWQEGMGTKEALQGMDEERQSVEPRMSLVMGQNGVDSEGNGYEFVDMPKYQDHTSAGTSLPSNKPTVYKAIQWKPGTKNLDIGGGRTEFANEYLRERDVTNRILDPYNRDAKYNLNAIRSLTEDGKYDTVTCANVLNVIDSAQSRRNVILEAAKALKPDGTAYFQIYEGDGKGGTRETSKGSQENRKTATYIDEVKQWFNNVEQWKYDTKTGTFKPGMGNIIVATDPKQDLPKAFWEYEEGKALRYSLTDITPEQQKFRDRNLASTEVGSRLFTLKGSPIARYKNIVGKNVGDQLYLHKLYANEKDSNGNYIVPQDLLKRAEDILKVQYPDFQYNTIMYDKKAGTIRFDEAPDFDTASEPIPGDYVIVNPTTGTTKADHSDYIWHHKWQWVMNDYQDRNPNGFDVAKSWEWSKRWLNELRGTDDKVSNRGVANGSGRGDANWRNQLEYFGLPTRSNATERYSLIQADADGRELSPGQQEYFKDSVVRDKDGLLKPMYHGTSNAGFTVFDPYFSKFGLFGNGFYFTDNPEVAESYTKKGKGNNPGVYQVYLNAKNLIDMDADADLAKWERTFRVMDVDLDYLRGAKTNEDVFRALKDYAQDAEMYKWEGEEFMQDILREAGYDGITHQGGGRYGDKNGPRHQVVIVFDQEQIKNTDNLNPTTNPDIRYSLMDSANENLAKTAQDNYNALIEVFRNDDSIHNEQRGAAGRETERLKEIFSADSVTRADDRSLYSSAIRRAGAFERVTFKEGPETLSTDVINRNAYTKEMLEVERRNKSIGFDTKFFLDDLVYADDGSSREVAGLADTDHMVMWVKANAINGKDSVVGYWGKQYGQFKGTNPANALARHERIHLLRKDNSSAAGKLANALFDLVDQENGPYSNVFDNINYWYQTHMPQGNYGFSDYSEEIASDIYAGSLLIDDRKARDAARAIVSRIDNAIGGDVRYSLIDDQNADARDEQLRRLMDRMRQQQNAKANAQAIGAAESGFAKGSSSDFGDWYINSSNTDRMPLSDEQADNATGERATRSAYRYPSRDPNGVRVMRTSQTLANSSVTDREMAQTLGNAAANGEFGYIEQPISKSTDKAKQTIEYQGWEGAYSEYKNAVDQGVSNRDLTALGIELYNNAVTAKDYYAALDVAMLLARNAHEAAGAMRMMRILSGLDANGKMYAMMRSIENIADGYKKLYPNVNLQLDDQLLQDYRNALIAQDQGAIIDAQSAIEQSIADQIKPTIGERINNWRYFSMLANPVTHWRNSLGNLGFAPIRLMKQGLKAGLERALLTEKNGQANYRTTAALNPLSENDRNLFTVAFKDAKNVMDVIQSGGKQTGPKDRIEEKRQIALTKVMDKVMKANTKALDFEDTIFSTPAYAEALASFLKARGVTADAFIDGDGTMLEFERGNISPQLMEQARTHAIKEAQKATYRDHNMFSDAIANIGKAGRTADANLISKGLSMAVEGVLPFKRTPANIMARAFEYSPLELFQVAIGDVKNLDRAGKALAAARAQNDGSAKSQQAVNAALAQVAEAKSQMIDHISSSATGTAIMLLGAFLRHKGRLIGGDDPDDEQANFNKLRGGQEYAFVDSSGNTYTIDWLAPEVLPLFTGVALYDKIFDASDDEKSFKKTFSDVFSGMYEPMLNMSMLSSLNDLISDVKYLEQDQQLIGIAKSVAGNLASQMVPTVFGKIENIGTDKKYSTYVDKESSLGKNAQYYIANVANKVPGWEYNQIVNYDAWGREQSSGNLLQRVVQNLVSPGYFKENRSTPYDDELQRLKDLGFDKVFPQKASQSQKVDQQYMTASEYELYTKTQGETQFKLIGDLLSSKVYAGMTDAQKADAVSDVYTAAKKAAETAVLKERGVEVKQTKAEKAKLDEVTYLTAKSVYDNAETPKGYKTTASGETSKWAKMLAVINDGTLSNADKLKFINAESGKNEPFKNLNEAKEYYEKDKEKAKK